MGADYIDYIIADRTVLPASQHSRYSEKIVALPDCYLPNDDKRQVAGDRPSRADAGLPEHGFIFCGFNNLYKLTPDVFAAWMGLLGGLRDSVLWLSQLHPLVRNLRGEAERAGIAPQRLVFAPFALTAEAHLARLSLADLFLDTLPYNAHASACDALWAGVPVLTCKGSTFAGRVGASALKAAGLDELVTDTLADYRHLGMRLAADADACPR